MDATSLCTPRPRHDHVHFTERKTECREVELPSPEHTVFLGELPWGPAWGTCPALPG